MIRNLQSNTEKKKITKIPCPEDTLAKTQRNDRIYLPGNINIIQSANSPTPPYFLFQSLLSLVVNHDCSSSQPLTFILNIPVWLYGTSSHNQSVQFSHSVVSDSLRPRGLQHASLPCPSPTPKLTQTHVHRVSDTIQPSHSLSLPSHPTFSLSQYRSLFQWVSSSHQVAKSWHFSFSISPPMNIQDWFPLGLTDWISLQSKGLPKIFSNTTVQKHQLFGVQLFYSPTLTSIHNCWLWLNGPLLAK